MAAVNPINQK